MQPQKSAPPRKRLGELLVEGGLIDRVQLEDALRAQAEQGTRLGTQLLMAGLITEAELAAFLSEQLGLPSMYRLSEVDPAAAQALPASIAVRHRVLPVKVTARGLLLAMADPFDHRALEAAREAARRPVQAMVAPELVVSYGIRRFYAPDPLHEPAPQQAKPQFARGVIELDALHR